MDGIDLLIVIAKVVVSFALALVSVILLVWLERKLVAYMQVRVGPQRAGPFGVLQGLADGVKLFFKESITPRLVERTVFLAAPVMALLPALLIFLSIPLGKPFRIGERLISMQGLDLNIGLLFILGMSSMAVYSVVLAGWSSGSKYPLIGGVRASAQMISYEAALGLSLIPVVIFAGTLRLSEFVANQAGNFGPLPAWHIFAISPSFVLFLLAAVAETNRAPFDLVEAESELVGGFHTEYSGVRFALFYLAEYLNVLSMSALAATLFLGGWNGPTFDGLLPGLVSALLPTVWLMLKTFAVIFLFFWVRATFPRLRYDQLMELGWKRMIPASLVWLVVFTLARSVAEFGVPWAS